MSDRLLVLIGTDWEVRVWQMPQAGRAYCDPSSAISLIESAEPPEIAQQDNRHHQRNQGEDG